MPNLHGILRASEASELLRVTGVPGALRGASERPSDALVLGPHRRRCRVLGLRDTGGAIIGMCVALQNGLQVESGPS